MKQLFLTLLVIVAITIFATKCHYTDVNVSTNYWWANYTGEIDSAALKFLQDSMFIINKKIRNNFCKY